MDAVLIAVADIANVDLGGNKVDDVTSGLTVLEQQVAQRSIAQSGSEIVLLSNGRRFNGDTASASAISQQHLLGAVDQVAIHQSVADIEGHRLQAAAVRQQLEVSGVAVLGNYWVGLIGVSDRRSGGVGWGVVDTSESEINGGNFTNSQVQSESAPCASYFVQQAIDVVIDGAATKACAHRCVGHAGSGNDGLAHATGKQSFAIARSGASGARTSKLNAERALNTSVRQQLLRCAQVRTNQITADDITLERSDAQIANQNGVGAGRSRIRAVRSLRLQKDQAFPS